MGLDERIDEGILWWFIYVERMERDRIAKRIYVRVCAGSRSVGRPQKRGLDVRQARRMVQDRSEWQRFVRGECMGCSPGDQPLTLMRCHSYMKPLEGGSLSVVNPTTYRT